MLDHTWTLESVPGSCLLVETAPYNRHSVLLSAATLRSGRRYWSWQLRNWLTNMILVETVRG